MWIRLQRPVRWFVHQSGSYRLSYVAFSSASWSKAGYPAIFTIGEIVSFLLYRHSLIRLCREPV